MAEKSQDNRKTSNQQSTAAIPSRSDVERGKTRPETNNNEPPPISKRNDPGGDTSERFVSFRNNNNENTRNRGGRFGVGSGTFGSANVGDSRVCYNCNKMGHISRNCPQSRQENNRSDSDRSVAFTSTASGGPSSMLITIRNASNQNEDNQNNNRNTKSTVNSRQDLIASRATDENKAESSGRCTIFYNSTMRGGYRGNRGGGGSSNYSNKSSHQSRDDGRASAQVPSPKDDHISDEAVTKDKNFKKCHPTQVRCLPEGKIKPIKSYEEVNLAAQVLSNIRHFHFEEPTPIQRYIIPCIRQQNDIIACASTGSGKTTAFLLPIISNLLEYHSNELSKRHQLPSPLCLILSPTRDLALKTQHEAEKFTYHTGVIPCPVVGGYDIHTISDHFREGCHIVSATTGRLIDMVQKGRISLTKVKYFILEEADRMLNTNFESDIHVLEDLGLPRKDKRFTSMFSVSFSDELQKVAQQFLRENYIFLTADTNQNIPQTIEEIKQIDKTNHLSQLIEQNLKSQHCLIFVETKQSANDIAVIFAYQNITHIVIQDDLEQKQRSQALQEFINGKYQIVIITSIVARNLDFPFMDCIVNYDLPDSIDFYNYCISRTGKLISFFDPDRVSDRKIVFDLVSKLTETGQQVPEFLKRYANAPDSLESQNQAVDSSVGTTFPNTAAEGGNEDEWEDEEQ